MHTHNNDDYGDMLVDNFDVDKSLSDEHSLIDKDYNSHKY